MKPKARGDKLGEGFLKPNQEVFKIEGSLFYQESAQAWNTIRLKREILFLYPQLKDKRIPVKYSMIIPKSSEDIMKQINEVMQSNKIPILLFLEKSQIEENKAV